MKTYYVKRTDLFGILKDRVPVLDSNMTKF